MAPVAPKVIDLTSLDNGIPAILPDMVGFYVGSAMVCFDENGHGSGVNLTVQDEQDTTSACQINWPDAVTEDHRRAFADMVRATDNGACAVALLLLREFTEFTAIEQAVIGTSVDYWLRENGSVSDDKYIFNGTARLEVSGILHESDNNTVEDRIRNKLRRLQPGLPAFVIVVEFSQPQSRIVRHG